MIRVIINWFIGNIIYSILAFVLILFIRYLFQQRERWFWKYIRIGEKNLRGFLWLYPKQGFKEEYIGLFGIAGYSEFILAIALIPRVFRLRENKRRKDIRFPLKLLHTKMSQQESEFWHPIAIYPFALKLPENTNHTDLIDNLRRDGYWERWIVDMNLLKGLKDCKLINSKSWDSVREGQQPYNQGDEIPKRIQNAFLLAMHSCNFQEGKKIILSHPITPNKSE